LITGVTSAPAPTIVPPSAADLLSAWEWGLPRSIPERGLALLAAVLPETTDERLRHLTVGARDVQLLLARRALFGGDLECVGTCPACSAMLELGISVDDLVGVTSVDADSDPELEAEGWRVCFRLVDSDDLIAAASTQDPVRARDVLLRRCVIEAVAPDGQLVDGEAPRALPPEVERALFAEMERRDAAARLELQLSCPDCGEQWTAPFDALGYLWAEVDGWATRTLREIHLLASAYGWPERDVLALSAWRRAAYLSMTGNG
jgi:hypothetical protein